jgi:hypothetical protein
MAAILDTAQQLAPSGLVSSSTDFTPLACTVRDLPVCAWAVHVSVPPVASATFTLAIATTTAGPWSTISTLVWPAGTAGARQVSLGASASLAQHLNLSAAFLRASVTLSGPLTLAGSWLSKPSDGGPGLGSRSYTLDAINPL